MLATQTPDPPCEAKEVKQWIKEKLALSLKALQKRYVTSDTVVTSEDGDANLLCSALEAIFIHGIKSKYIRSETGGRSRKGDRGPLPQPFFWKLLKTVTHRDVVAELEKLSFVGTDVGQCRAWLRLALNHGLLECYLASLFREGSKLQAYYQPSALLLDPEEREVLLSYLQGLASLTFSLSYKSAVLNEWTTTPLALAGLCPASLADLPDPSHAASRSKGKDSWDSTSQSSGSSDIGDVPRPGGCPGEPAAQGTPRTILNSSNLSLDTTGSSQLSSSLSSDSLLQGQDPRSPAGEPWSSCDLEIPSDINSCSKMALKGGSRPCSQDSMQEDSFVSSTGLDQFSENTASSGSDSETQGPAPASEATEPELGPAPPSQLSLRTSGSDQDTRSDSPPEIPPDSGVPLSTATSDTIAVPLGPQSNGGVAMETSSECSVTTDTSLVNGGSRWSASVLSRKLSSDSLSHSRSWISEEDFYKPHLEELEHLEEAPPPKTSAEARAPPSPPSVVHRRQMGLFNPFRGLLKLGHLERRGAVGLWRDYYCELSPFEFRLYMDAEERTCSDNCSLLRCEDVGAASPDGRFELAFPGKRLQLRAATRDEAEDWVDRVLEAVRQCRPAPPQDDQWEVLQDHEEAGTPGSAPSSPRCGGQVEEAEREAELDWTRGAAPEPDAIKEAVLYCCWDAEGRAWQPLVFSLSLEALRGFRLQDGRKTPRLSLPIQGVRDVVPDVALGGADFFKLLTRRETLRLRAQTPEEARSWRALIRGALDSYLESVEDGAGEGPPMPAPSLGGNIHRLVQHQLKEDAALLDHLCTAPPQRGLDTQNFKCAGCPRQVGLSLGKARLCHFSSLYYCDSCHHGDTSIIPSRLVHNWDLAQREVSRKALGLLAQVEQEPLLNLQLLNPGLLEHAELMVQVHSLRRRLRLLGEYLLTCRSGACRKLQARMEQRPYLLESSHLYSVMDLRQIAEGHYASYLSSLVQFACDHVHQCDLCTQRGFICQVCHADDIIFPFQFDTTTRCKGCKAVFHSSCRSDPASCPRCIRIMKYLERDQLS